MPLYNTSCPTVCNNTSENTRRDPLCVSETQRREARIDWLSQRVDLFHTELIKKNKTVGSHPSINNAFDVISSFYQFKTAFIENKKDCNASSFYARKTFETYDTILVAVDTVASLNRDNIPHQITVDEQQDRRQKALEAQKSGKREIILPPPGSKCLCDKTSQCDKPLMDGMMDYCMCDNDCA